MRKDKNTNIGGIWTTAVESPRSRPGPLGVAAGLPGVGGILALTRLRGYYSALYSGELDSDDWEEMSRKADEKGMGGTEWKE